MVPVLLAVLALALLTAAFLLRPSAEAVTKLQEFWDKGLNLPPAYCMAVWSPKGLVWDVALCAALALAWWWGRRTTAPSSEVEAVKGGQKVWMIVGAVVVLSGFLNAPRLSQGLWADEVLTMRNVVVGRVKHDTKGVLRVIPTAWHDTAFNYWVPNNHVLYSLAARVSHNLWPKDRSPTAPYFSEVGLRLPAFLAGLAALAMLAMLAIRLGLREPAVVAVALLALHPWYVRYSTEARGYSFLLLMTPALLYCTVEAARSGRWRWWLVVGVMQFLMLYTQPLSLHVVVPAALSALLLVLAHWSSNRDRMTMVARMASGSLVGAMLALPLMLPLYPQLKKFLAGATAQWEIDGTWMKEAASQFGLGMHWIDFDASNPNGVMLELVAKEHPWLMPVLVCVVLTVLLAGVVAFWRHSLTTRCLLPALLLPALELTVVHAISGKILLPWYLVIGLPGFAFLMGAGVMAMAGALTPRTWQPMWKVATAGGVACVLFGWATHNERLLLRTVPIDPRREAASLYLPTFNHKDPRIESVLTAGIGPPITVDLAYDPLALCIRSVEELREAEAIALRTNRPLFVNCPRYPFAVHRSADVLREMESSGAFDLVGNCYGADRERGIRVYRFKAESRVFTR